MHLVLFFLRAIPDDGGAENVWIALQIRYKTQEPQSKVRQPRKPKLRAAQNKSIKQKILPFLWTALFVVVFTIGAENGLFGMITSITKTTPTGTSFSTATNHLPQQTVTSTKWWSGGTLHKSRAAEWNRAAHSNKLATVADWSYGVLKNRRDVSTPEKLRPYAQDLLFCMNGVAVEPSSEDLNLLMQELAAICAAQMGWGS